jgi:hypothetical protein
MHSRPPKTLSSCGDPSPRAAACGDVEIWIDPARIDHSPDVRVYARQGKNARPKCVPSAGLLTTVDLILRRRGKARFDPPA